MQQPDPTPSDDDATTAPPRVTPMSGQELVRLLEEAGVVGMWADREDITDSAEFARELRRRAQTRTRDVDSSP